MLLLISIEIMVSLPSRGAWIEIGQTGWTTYSQAVAPLAGSVDRNHEAYNIMQSQRVAPLAGSVDRNDALHPFQNL